MTRILLVDHHDSYSYNVRELVAAALGTVPDVVLHDDPAVDEDRARRYHAVVLSPGPGAPQVAADAGASPRLLTAGPPVLGVCLGLQLMVVVAGGEVGRIRPRHGHVSRIRHAGTGLFTGLPQDFAAVRYNSLGATQPLPADLVADAWAEDGTLMGLHHRTRPWWAVQFHPESVASECGVELVRAFARVAGLGQWRPVPVSAGRAVTTSTSASGLPPGPGEPGDPGGAAGQDLASAAITAPAEGGWAGHSVHLVTREVPAPEVASAHGVLCGDRDWSFWLDSARLQPGAGRWSFMGRPEGPASVLRANNGHAVEILDDQGAAGGTDPGGVLAALQARLATAVTGADELPLRGGWVGYLGYEALEPRHHPALPAGPGEAADAVWMRASRYLAIDHDTDRAWLVAEVGPGGEAAARAWLETTARRLAAVAPLPPLDVEPAGESFWQHAVRDTPEQYRAKVARAQEFLHAGESYEVCLTTEARMPFTGDPAQAYLRLRTTNPAPHAAFLRMGPTSVLSSSPERFLQVSPDGWVETRPIKGTTSRHPDPGRDRQHREALLADAKTRSELLMIVDLLRNDLARVCRTGSVVTPEPAVVESYASLHQLFARIGGQLPPGAGVLDALVATFPGGSMTGAPKERTMAILGGLEARRRGPYSGTLGYLSADGAADLSIIIRTGVVSGGELVVGAGGAVTLDSTPDGEYEEMRWKLAAPLRGLLGTSVAVRAERTPTAS